MKSFFFLFLCIVLLAIPMASASSFVVAGHLYTLQEAPDIRDLFVEEINAMPEIDAVILLGDNVNQGNEEEWLDFEENFLNKINPLVYMAPGNHEFNEISGDYEKAYVAYKQRFGPTSKKVSYFDVNLYILDSVNPQENNYNWSIMAIGGGLDRSSVNLLKNIEENDKINLAFMHHSLYSSELRYPHQTWFGEKFFGYNEDSVKISDENEKVWEEEIAPLISGKIDAVFMGDKHLNKKSKEEVDGVFYYGNAFKFPREKLGYTIINIEGSDLNVEFKEISVPRESSYTSKYLNYKFNQFKSRISKIMRLFF